MYVYTPDGERVEESTLLLPYYSQGVAFADVGKSTYMLVSGSRGRYITSTLHIYKAKKDKDNISIAEKVGEITFPNMSEDIDIQGDDLFSCCESASNYYHMPLDGGVRSKNAVDRIMVNSVRCLIHSGLGYR